MPYGVKQGRTVEIIAQFSGSSGGIILAPGLVVFLNVAYTDAITGSLAAFSKLMSQSGYDFLATWPSSAAAIGSAVVSFKVGATVLSPPDSTLRINLNNQ